MAYPTMVINNTVHQFIFFWNCGLQPSLSLDTSENGEIIASFKVTSNPPTGVLLQPKVVALARNVVEEILE